MERRNRDLELLGSVDVGSPGQELSATDMSDGSFFDFDKLEESARDIDEEGGGREHDVRELIHHWSRSNADHDQPTDETRLAYDADGLDKYGRAPSNPLVCALSQVQAG